MKRADLDGLEKIEEGLALAFYVFMFMALTLALAGQAGSACWLLLLGSCAHVGRAGLAEFVERRRQQAQHLLAERPAGAGREADRPRSARRAAA